MRSVTRKSKLCLVHCTVILTLLALLGANLRSQLHMATPPYIVVVGGSYVGEAHKTCHQRGWSCCLRLISWRLSMRRPHRNFRLFLSKHTSSSNKAAWGSLKLCSSYKRLCRNHLEDSGDMELLQEEGLAASRPLPLTTLSSAMI
jgi:hypothetical protein